MTVTNISHDVEGVPINKAQIVIIGNFRGKSIVVDIFVNHDFSWNLPEYIHPSILARFPILSC
jgi:hypothetical protein